MGGGGRWRGWGTGSGAGVRVRGGQVEEMGDRFRCRGQGQGSRGGDRRRGEGAAGFRVRGQEGVRRGVRRRGLLGLPQTRDPHSPPADRATHV